MTYVFEEFTEKDKRGSNILAATITKAGNINFNKAFRVKYGDDLLLEQAVFLYDRENRVICLKLVGVVQDNSYSLRELPNSKGLTISARAFLNHFGIPFEKETLTYETEFNIGRDVPKIFIYLKKRIKK